ncbi:MAG: SDR family NAD(P)-dependent oxidoreductase [Pseudomonadota bacterium]
MGILEGRIAIVTGASSGVGRGCAVRFAEEGAKLVITARRTEKLEALVKEIAAKGGTAISVTCDVVNEEDIDNVVNTTIKEFGTVDVLANIAQGALQDMTYLTGVTPKGALEAFVTGPLQTMLFMQKCYPYMKKQGYGRIINTSSHSCLVGAPGFAAYEMAKGAIMALTRNAAKEWGGFGIVTNACLPIVRTEAYDMTPQGRDAASRIESEIPVGHFGKAYEDCSQILAFMASEGASYLNGQFIGIDGGLILIA